MLLQKTLLNIEGLGRQLYPQLDLWTTAKPFLDRWLKQRYSPKSLFNQFKQLAPDWLEQLPEIPPLIYSALKTAQQTAENPAVTTVVTTSAPMAKQQPLRRLIPWLSAAAVGVGFGLAVSSWTESLAQVPVISLTLVGVGLLVLLLR